MKIFGMGGLELVIILVIVLIIFGPKNLPKLGKAIGNGIQSLRKGVESGKDKIDEKFEEVESEKAEAAKAEGVGSAAPEPEAVEADFEEVEETETEEAGQAEGAKKTVKIKRVVKKEAGE